MKPRIAIGITTYKDIGSPEFGRRVFDAYASLSTKMLPTQVKVRSKKIEISGRDDFAAVWRTEETYVLRENRAKNSTILKKGTFNIGAEWRTGSPVGVGGVEFRPNLDSNGTNIITISHAYSPRFDWPQLFRNLVEETEPAYAMLHLFTEREISSSPAGDGFERFDQAFGGEHWFTSFRSPSGLWDVPDTLRLERRKNYKFLPELSWANVLGPEFSGNYDPDIIAQRAAWYELGADRVQFGITKSIRDVVENYDAFNLARVRLRAAFPPRSFHRSNLGVVQGSA